MGDVMVRNGSLSMGLPSICVVSKVLDQERSLIQWSAFDTTFHLPRRLTLTVTIHKNSRELRIVWEVLWLKRTVVEF